MPFPVGISTYGTSFLQLLHHIKRTPSSIRASIFPQAHSIFLLFAAPYSFPRVGGASLYLHCNTGSRLCQIVANPYFIAASIIAIYSGTCSATARLSM